MDLKCKLNVLEVEAETNTLSKEEKKKNILYWRKILLEFEPIKSIDLKHKELVKWIIVGDENSRFSWSGEGKINPQF